MKKCSKCGVVKEASEFAKSSTHKDGLQYWCRTCNTEAHREWGRRNPDKVKAARERQDQVHVRNTRRFYMTRRRGVLITREEFDAALLVTECPICHKHIEAGTQDHHLDHDYVTGQFRGALCRGCNLALGHFGESLERMRAAVAYLEAAQARYNPNAEPLPPTPGRTGRKKIEHE